MRHVRNGFRLQIRLRDQETPARIIRKRDAPSINAASGRDVCTPFHVKNVRFKGEKEEDDNKISRL